MSNERYTVTNRIQSRGNPPVEMNWLRNGSPAETISAVASIIAQGDDKDSNVPARFRPRLLGITVIRTPESTPPWADEGNESLPGEPTVAEEATVGTAESFRLAHRRMAAELHAEDPTVNDYGCCFCGALLDSLILVAIHYVTDHLPVANAAELDGALDYIREAASRLRTV